MTFTWFSIFNEDFRFPYRICPHFRKATCHPKIAMALPWPSQALKGRRSLEDVDPTSPAEKDLTWPLPRGWGSWFQKKITSYKATNNWGIYWVYPILIYPLLNGEKQLGARNFKGTTIFSPMILEKNNSSSICGTIFDYLYLLVSMLKI